MSEKIESFEIVYGILKWKRLYYFFNNPSLHTLKFFWNTSTYLGAVAFSTYFLFVFALAYLWEIINLQIHHRAMLKNCEKVCVVYDNVEIFKPYKEKITLLGKKKCSH